MRILVVGASGKVGGEVVTQLLALPNPPSIRVSSRDPTSAKFPSSVEVVQGDLTDPSSYSRLFTDIDRVFLYCPHGGLVPSLCDSIKSSGVQHVVLLSSVTAETAPASGLGRMHTKVEDAIKEAKLPYTFIRPTAFASSSLHWWAEQISQTNIVAIPYPNFHSAVITENDVASVAVVALTTDRLINQALAISGPEDLSQPEQIEVISQVREKAGKGKVEVKELTGEEWRERVKEHVPAGLIDALLEFWKGGDGKPEQVNSVEQYTGRKGTTFAEWVEKHQADFTK